MAEYEVTVGNVGTVHTGSSRKEANFAFDQYVDVSRTGSMGRAAGEQVTLFEDGEPVKEHQGWVWLYDTFSDNENLQTFIADARAEAPGDCPVCHTSIDPKEYHEFYFTIYDDGKDHRLNIGRHCKACGFKFHDILRVVGAGHDPAGRDK